MVAEFANARQKPGAGLANRAKYVEMVTIQAGTTIVAIFVSIQVQAK